MKQSNNLIDSIYGLEALCYYFGMKPKDFWEATYREVNVYAQSNIINRLDGYRQEIQLQEAVTNKMIQADAMSNRRPKIVSLKKTFENLFPEEEVHYQTPQEIAEIMRNKMKQ